MKYLEGSRFTVHVGSSAYTEGWDRIFGKPSVPEPEPEPEPEPAPESAPASVPAALRADVGCFDCGHTHAAEMSCWCMCHALDASSAGK